MVTFCISMLVTLAGVFVFLPLNVLTKGDRWIVCYYTSWPQYRYGRGRYIPRYIDPSLCTHIIFAFANLQVNHAERKVELGVYDSNDESPWSQNGYQSFRATIEPYPDVKRLVAVGGWKMGTRKFTMLVRIVGGIKYFAETSVTYIRRRKFQGLDLDWEYPGSRGSPATDKVRYTALVRQLRITYAAESLRTRQPRLLITMAVAAGFDKIAKAYEIKKLCRDVDLVSVMTYDFHGSWDKKVGHHTQLYSAKNVNVSSLDARYNADYAMRLWAQNCPKQKLLLGLALYARSFTLTSDSTALNSPAYAGNPGFYTGVSGHLCYYEVCDLINKGGALKYLPDQKVFYVLHKNQWIGGPTEESLRYKVCYAKKNGYGGVMVWDLSCDDFTGTFCGKHKYPLLKAVKYQMHQSTPCKEPNRMAEVPSRRAKPRPVLKPTPPEPTPPPIPVLLTNAVDSVKTQTQQASTTQASFDENFCKLKVAGLYPNPNDCATFYSCSYGRTYLQRCSGELLFNPNALVCDYRSNVVCNTS